MKRISYLSCVLLCFTFSTLCLAQTADIKGIVLTARNAMPLVGANVFINGTSIGSTTDLEGKFHLSHETSEEFILVVSFMGYKTREIKLNPLQAIYKLKIEMIEDVFQFDEIVVTGIASKTAKSVAEVAVSRLKADELTKLNSYQEISQMVTGKIAGVNIEPSSGTGFCM